MAKIPTPTERVVFSGVRVPGQSSGGGGQPSALGNYLQNWAAQEQQRQDQEALERVQQAATRAQQGFNRANEITDEPRIAPAPGNVTGVFEEQWELTSRAIFAADLQARAQDAAFKLQQENKADPDAYAEKFDAWMRGQIAPLQEVDAVAGEEARLALDRVGRTRLRKVQEEAAGIAQQQSTTALLDTIDGHVRSYQDELRAAPDAEVLGEALATVRGEIDAALEAGTITASWANQKKTVVQQDLRREFVRGRFFQAVEQDTPDVEAAQGVIESLKRGKWFDDNDYGRRVASQLQTELNSLLGAAQNGLATQLDLAWDTLENSRDLDTPPSNPQRRQAEELIMLHGGRDDQLKYQTWQQTQQYLDELNTAGAAKSKQDLLGMRATLQSNPAAFDGDADQAVAALDARIERIDAATAAGNYLQDSTLQLGATPGEIHTERVFAGARHGVSLDMVPYASPRMASQAGERYGSANEAGEARAVLEQFMGGVPGWDVTGRVATAGMLQGRLAGFGAAAALAPETGALLHDLAFNGSKMQGDRLQEMQDDYQDTLREEIIATAEVLGMGNPNVSDDMEEALTRGLYQLAWDMKDSDGDVESEYEAYLTPYLDTTELNNGTFVPKAFASPAEVEAINERLDEILAKTGDPAFVEALVPHPMPEGQWAFRSRRSSQLIPSFEDDSKPLVLDARPAIEQAVEEQMTEDAGFFSRATGGRTWQQQMLHEDIPRAASQTGGDSDLLQAIFLAGLKTPGSEKLEQEHSMMWSRENAGVVPQSEYAAAWRNAVRDPDAERQARVNPLGGDERTPPDPLRDPAAAAVYASLLLERLVEKYGVSRKMLAAYYLGEAAVAGTGDEWEENLGDDHSQFISRVMGRLNAR